MRSPASKPPTAPRGSGYGSPMARLCFSRRRNRPWRPTTRARKRSIASCARRARLRMACCPSCPRGGSGAVGIFERDEKGEIQRDYCFGGTLRVFSPEVCGVEIVGGKVGSQLESVILIGSWISNSWYRFDLCSNIFCSASL